LGPDTAHGEDEYAVVRADLDDALMRRAVEEVGDPGDYTLLSNNCQAYVQNVLAVYDRLASE